MQEVLTLRKTARVAQPRVTVRGLLFGDGGPARGREGGMAFSWVLATDVFGSQLTEKEAGILVGFDLNAFSR